MFIIGSDQVKINKVKAGLTKEFKIKDLSLIKYFLGVRIIRDRSKKTITLY